MYRTAAGSKEPEIYLTIKDVRLHSIGNTMMSSLDKIAQSLELPSD